MNKCKYLSGKINFEKKIRSFNPGSTDFSALGEVISQGDCFFNSWPKCKKGERREQGLTISLFPAF